MTNKVLPFQNIVFVSSPKMQMERTAFHLKAEGECQADWKQEEFRAANKQQQQKLILYHKILKNSGLWSYSWTLVFYYFVLKYRILFVFQDQSTKTNSFLYACFDFESV